MGVHVYFDSLYDRIGVFCMHFDQKKMINGPNCTQNEVFCILFHLILLTYIFIFPNSHSRMSRNWIRTFVVLGASYAYFVFLLISYYVVCLLILCHSVVEISYSQRGIFQTKCETLNPFTFCIYYLHILKRYFI